MLYWLTVESNDSALRSGHISNINTIAMHFLRIHFYITVQFPYLLVFFTTQWMSIRVVEVQLQIFFDLCTRWRWVVSFTTRPLYHQENRPRCPLDGRSAGPQSRSELCGEEKDSQPLPELRTPDHPARSAALYRWAWPYTISDDVLAIFILLWFSDMFIYCWPFRC
jgi:hypothetical protein